MVKYNYSSSKIPNGYNEAIVKTTIASPRYSQNNILYYLQYLHGAQLASSIETGDIQALISLILCFVPNVQVPGFMIGLIRHIKQVLPVI